MNYVTVIAVLLTAFSAFAGGSPVLPNGFSVYPETAGRRTGAVTAAPDGNAEAWVLTDDGDGEIGLMRAFPATAGKAFRFSAELRLPEGEPAFREDTFFLQLLLPGANGLRQTAVYPGMDGWTQIRMSGVADRSGRAFCHIYSRKKPRGRLLVRSLRLEESEHAFPVEPVVFGRNFLRLSPAAASNRGDGVKQLSDGSLLATSPNRGENTLKFRIPSPIAGVFRTVLICGVDDERKSFLKKALGKENSLTADFSWNGGKSVARVAYPPWIGSPVYESCVGKFSLRSGGDELLLAMPQGLRFYGLRFECVRPVAVPERVAKYMPRIVPGAAHPRLWITPDGIAGLKQSMAAPEHREAVEYLKKRAERALPDNPHGQYNPRALQGAIDRAFLFLAEENAEAGREAVRYMTAFLPEAEFGNMLDVTREIGYAVYAAALVYDWCFPLLSDSEKTLLRTHMLRLASDMEIGWPPFLQPVATSHGNEAQLNRDLLSMAIAIHGEDSEPYRYCAYRILEELVPMCRAEYASPRHGQGAGYGAYRFAWELHAAWLMRRMTGREIFDPNLKQVAEHFLYAELPDGETFKDGDDITGRPWKYPVSLLLAYTYGDNGVLRGRFEKQGGWKNNPVLFLLLDRPGRVKAEPRDTLPLARITGEPLGSLNIRTGWDLSRFSRDLAVEITGGGVHWGGHHHASAGAFQIYYHGMQACDVGQYVFFGTPYDYNFNKRSISKNLLLIYDSSAVFSHATGNDGGQNFVLKSPETPADLTPEQFNAGRLLCADFGPDAMRSVYGVFRVDLTKAYAAKTGRCERTLVFLSRPGRGSPGCVLICDRVENPPAQAALHWRIHTPEPPLPTPGGLVSVCRRGGLAGQMFLDMPEPAPERRTLAIQTGSEMFDVFGKHYASPNPRAPEAHSSCAGFSLKNAGETETFFTVLRFAEEGAVPSDSRFFKNTFCRMAAIGDNLVIFPEKGVFPEVAWNLEIPENMQCSRILLVGVPPGDWILACGKDPLNMTSLPGRMTIFAKTSEKYGRLTLLPGRTNAAKGQECIRAEIQPPLSDEVVWNGKTLKNVSPLSANGRVFLPLDSALCRAFGISCRALDAEVFLTCGKEELRLSRKGGAVCNGVPFAGEFLHAASGEFPAVDAELLADFLRLDFDGDPEKQLAVFSRRPRENECGRRIFRFSENGNTPQREFRRMLRGRGGYWAKAGRSVAFDVVLTSPLELSKVELAWLNGERRRTAFRLSVLDSSERETVLFDGRSSGRAGVETYPVPDKIGAVSRLRMVCFGNDKNDWNSIEKLNFYLKGETEK